jgi:hypothetical protein
VVAEIIRQIEAAEQRVGSRQRRRRADDQRTFEETVSAVVCDLTHRALTEPGGWLSVSLSNRVLGRAGRYGSRVFGKTLPDLLGTMANKGFLELVKGHQGHFGGARFSTMRAGIVLLDRIKDRELGLDDLGRTGGEEVIILKQAREDDEDHAEWVDYAETETTRRYPRGNAAHQQVARRGGHRVRGNGGES